jgi:hypothetical protein
MQLHPLLCNEKNLQKPGQPRSDAFLSLDKLHLLRSSVQLIQRVGTALLVEIILDLAESLAELAIQYLRQRDQTGHGMEK